MNKADVNGWDFESSYKPIHVAQGIESYRLLLDGGADKTINKTVGGNGKSVLYHAIQNLNVDMVKLLLKYGADPASVDEDGIHAREFIPSGDQRNKLAIEAITHLLK